MSSRRALLIAVLAPALLAAQRFYPDDPLLVEPAPMNVPDASVVEENAYIEVFENTLSIPGERQPPDGHIIAGNINTLGDVPDSPWYTNRHRRRRMSLAELTRGPDRGGPPGDGAWNIVSAKTSGITPGFVIEDRMGRRYLLKFDPPGSSELATGAEVVSSRFFHAFGYDVPENHLVYFERDRLVLASDSMLQHRSGNESPLRADDVTMILGAAPRSRGKGYRAVASLLLPGKALGPLNFDGTRPDDPNDIVPHEHHRELRGLFVFCAWLSHYDIRETNTLDTLVEENGLRLIRHYLLDFNAALGSESTEPKHPGDGYEYLFSWGQSLKKAGSLGFYLPAWVHARFPDYPAIGRFESTVFEPEDWKPRTPLPIFENRLPDDNFWAARQVMAFTEEEIRAIVKTGDYSDPAGEQWLVKCLMERRQKIGRTYFSQVLPLDAFHVAENRLEFVDLAIRYGFLDRRDYQVRWSKFDNTAGRHTPLEGDTGFEIPAPLRVSPAGSYIAARITGEDQKKTVTVYLRQGDGWQVVGVERSW